MIPLGLRTTTPLPSYAISDESFSALARTVDRLVAKKLIRRQAGEHDRREHHLELTTKGERRVEELAYAHYRELAKRSEEMIKGLRRLRD